MAPSVTWCSLGAACFCAFGIAAAIKAFVGGYVLPKA
jgi:hypothetical protein